MSVSLCFRLVESCLTVLSLCLCVSVSDGSVSVSMYLTVLSLCLMVVSLCLCVSVSDGSVSVSMCLTVLSLCPFPQEEMLPGLPVCHGPVFT